LFSLLSTKPAESFSAISSQRRQDVSSFFLTVQLSQPYIATGHTSAFISLIFVEIGMLWLFHIFSSDALIACLLFNPVRNSVVHSPSSVIRDPGYGNLSTCSSCSFWMRMRHAMLCRCSPIPWSCQRWLVGCICGWLGLGDPPTPVVLPAKWPTGWCYQHSERSWVFALQCVIHLEIHRGSSSSPCPLGCWASMEKGQPCRTPFVIQNHSDSVPATLTLASCFQYSLASKSIKCRVYPMSIIVTQSLSWEIESNVYLKSIKHI